MRGDNLQNPRHGATNGRAKLTEEQVLKIRELASTGSDVGHGRPYNQYRLAEMFGVTQSSISYIISRKTWRHV